VSAISNLSAVKLEIGNYAGCIIFCQKALKLLDTQAPADDVAAAAAEQKRQKLYARHAKAAFCCLRLDEAEGALSKVTSEEVHRELETSVVQTRRWLLSLPDSKVQWYQIIQRLARYRPAL
jgi:hypothetical protein